MYSEINGKLDLRHTDASALRGNCANRQAQIINQGESTIAIKKQTVSNPAIKLFAPAAAPSKLIVNIVARSKEWAQIAHHLKAARFHAIITPKALMKK